MMPSLFVAHGSPMIAIEDTAYADFLGELGTRIGRPRAVVVFSAHWESARQMLSTAARHAPMYDFGGFPEALYQVRYTPPGDPDLGQKLAASLQELGVSVEQDRHRALDHGVWTVLCRLFPKADVAVIAMSVNAKLDPKEQYRIGAALGPWRSQNVLIIGSGVTVHNFELLRQSQDAQVKERVLAFEDWLEDALKRWDLNALFHYETAAPHAAMAVPRLANEHFAPLFYAMGAAEDQRKTTTLYRDLQWNVMTNSVYQFG